MKTFIDKRNVEIVSKIVANAIYDFYQSQNKQLNLLSNRDRQQVFDALQMIETLAKGQVNRYGYAPIRGIKTDFGMAVYFFLLMRNRALPFYAKLYFRDYWKYFEQFMGDAFALTKGQGTGVSGNDRMLNKHTTLEGIEILLRRFEKDMSDEQKAELEDIRQVIVKMRKYAGRTAESEDVSEEHRYLLPGTKEYREWVISELISPDYIEYMKKFEGELKDLKHLDY